MRWRWRHRCSKTLSAGALAQAQRARRAKEVEVGEVGEVELVLVVLVELVELVELQAARQKARSKTCLFAIFSTRRAPNRRELL